MKTQDEVNVVFVNTVLARGILNGVVNLSFSTFNFSPNGADGIDADPVVSCRLRMDRVCLKQLHEVTGTLLAAIEASELPKAETETSPMEEGVLPKATTRREKAH